MSPAEPAPTLPAAASASTAPAVANAQIAELFEQVATLLAQQGASPFRVGAYRRAGQSLKRLGRDVRAIAEAEGRRGLLAIPGIGVSLASAIEEILRSGRWVQLERLRGASDPEHLFQTVAGIGPELARRIHERLHIDTLEALELAAHDGRLESVPGMGARRVAAIRSLLLSMLQRVRTVPPKPLVEPEAALLLERRPRIPRARRRGPPAQDRPQALQSCRRGLAPHPPRRARRVAFHRPLLQHRARP